MSDHKKCSGSCTSARTCSTPTNSQVEVLNRIQFLQETLLARIDNVLINNSNTQTLTSVSRYEIVDDGCMLPHITGDWVTWSDYISLFGLIGELKGQISNLEAENKRMHKFLYDKHTLLGNYDI